MSNMQDQYRKFPVEEYHDRICRIKALLEREKLNGLFITDGTNFNYLCGVGAGGVWGNARPVFLILPLEGEPIAIVQSFSKDGSRSEIWVRDLRFYDSLRASPYEAIVGAFSDARLTRGNVGAELGFEQRLGIPYDDFLILQRMLPNVKFVDGADILWGARMIKSPREVELIRKACQITVQAYDSLFPSLQEGLTESDIMKEFLRLQFELGGVNPWGVINSGPENYSFTSDGPTDRRIRRGDQLWIDGGCRFCDYGSDHNCAGTVGTPSSAQKRMQDLVTGITHSIVSQIKPGKRACDLDALNLQEWEVNGFDYKRIDFGAGRIGHGMGLFNTEPPHISHEDTTILVPGMVFTIEPGITTEFGCYQAETNVLVTESGYEILNQTNHDLRIIKTSASKT